MSQTRTIICTHLPVDGKIKEIQSYFSEVGALKKCFMIRNNDTNEFKGIAYITYASANDATVAVEKFNNASYLGKIISVKYSKQRDNNEVEEHNPINQEIPLRIERNKKTFKNEAQKNISEHSKEVNRQKKGRIIIRNLSFKADENAVRKHFEGFGEITEVSILKKKDGKMIGCAFVQFTSNTAANSAIKECNMKPLLGRNIAVDVAVPKILYESVVTKSIESIPSVGNSFTEVKNLIITDSNLLIKEENDSDNGLEKDSKITSKDFNNNSDNEDNYSDTLLDDKSKPSMKPIQQVHSLKSANPKKISNDILEGRTLFIKNLSFDATEEDIAERLNVFGDIKYVILCIDRLTEHPKGTAFVQFKILEAANACLEAEKNPLRKEEFNIHGRQMHIMKAISRGDISCREQDTKTSMKKKKDKRNLYLAREGVVRQGTRAAVGVSPQDLDLRTRREHVKRHLLKNLNTFVSRTRLCVNNLPENFTDTMLKYVFKTYAPKIGKIIEAKIMRNFSDVGEDGIPKSRGYGFVNLTEHHHALAALRAINNNPSIFTKDRRPIVEFSIENRIAMNARKNRAEKSREKNPLWKNRNAEQNQEDKNKKINKNIVKIDLTSRPSFKSSPTNTNQDQEEKDDTLFLGSIAKPGQGVSTALSSHVGPKIRHQPRPVHGKGKITRKQIKKQKDEQLRGKKRSRPNHEKHLEDESILKRAKVKESDSGLKTNKKSLPSKNQKRDYNNEKQFSSLVEKYKSKMISAEVDKKKWHE